MYLSIIVLFDNQNILQDMPMAFELIEIQIIIRKSFLYILCVYIELNEHSFRIDTALCLCKPL